MSVKPAPVIATKLVFCKVMVMLLTPPTAKSVAMMFLTTTGVVSAPTMTGVVTKLPVVATGPALVGMTLLGKLVPALFEVTLTTTWQVAPAAKLATLRRTLLSPALLTAPAVVLMVPHAAGVKAVVVLDSVRPAGKVSGSWTVVNGPGLAAGLVTPKVIVVVPPAVMMPPMTLVAVGGVKMLTVCAVTPLTSRLLIDVMSAAALVRAPAVMPRTVSVIEQVAPAAISMLLAVNGCVALAAVNTGEPQFELDGAAGLVICSPACKVSVNDCPVCATLFVPVFAMAKVNVVVPFKAMSVAPNAFVSIGRDCTVKLAVFETVPGVGVCVVVTPDVTFGWTPATLLLTLNVIVQLPLAGMVSPVIEIDVWLLARLLVPAPAHVPAADCAPATDILLSVSVKLAPVRGTPFVLVNVKVMVLAVTPSFGIAAGAKALAIVGETPTTVRFAVFEPEALANASGPVNEIAEAVFGNVPGVSLVTSNEMVQVPLATLAIVNESAPVC